MVPPGLPERLCGAGYLLFAGSGFATVDRFAALQKNGQYPLSFCHTAVADLSFFLSLYYIHPMKNLVTLCILPLFAFCYCSNGTAGEKAHKNSPVQQQTSAFAAGTHWKGSFSNGMEGNQLSFDVQNGEVQNLTFKGYWYCDGKLEQTTLGPKKGFVIRNKKADGVQKESGFYFELHGTFNGKEAAGTLRIAFVAGSCDTYELKWTARQQ